MVRCEPEDRSVIRWASKHLQLEQSEVIRQGIRIGVPMLVKRMKRVRPTDRESVQVRAAFKRPVKMAEILKATEEAH